MEALFHSVVFITIIILYFILSLVGIGLVYLSFHKTASANVELKKALTEEKLKNEQARNCNSIMRLLRQWQDSFPPLDKLSLTVEHIQSSIRNQPEKHSTTTVDRESTVTYMLNQAETIKQLTSSLDLAELILRKIQAVNLEEEDREILRTEFIHIYEQNCKPMLHELNQLKKRAPYTKTTPYELLDAAPTIELLENYFEV